MKGYRDNAKNLLKSASVDIGDRIKIRKRGQEFEGLLMPRTKGEAADHIVMKLDSGYNIGIKATEDTEIEKIREGKEPEMRRHGEKVEPDADKPNISIIGTGGTVASRVDYRTGAVHPAFSASEIYNSAPEIAEIANIETNNVCNVLSENMTPELWSKVGNAVAEDLNDGADGVIVAHGTDTMSYTASALSFMLKNLSKPVVLVGSQRSSDRPSSDVTLNLTGAVSVAISNLAEVCVVMHGSTEDEFCLIHRGTKVRKCHTSRRDAFQSINDLPLGIVRDKSVRFFQDKKGRRKNGKVEVEDGFEEKVALVKIFPSIQGEIIEKLIEDGYKGIVLEGTGLGHTPESLFSGIEKAIEKNIPVAMTSQCIWGRTNMRVYSTGRDLLDLGVFPVEDMLPETALVKMMWILDKTQEMEEVQARMKENIAGEISSRTRADTFLKPKIPGEE